MAEHLPDREAREDHVAEVAPAAFLRRYVDRDAGHRLEPWQPPAELRKLILAAASRKPRIRKIVGDFLQAEHVEIGDFPRLPDYPRQINLLVDAAAPLRIPSNQLHLIPALMNDCTNCFWNSKNATSSGAVASKVAAVTIDQSIP